MEFIKRMKVWIALGLLVAASGVVLGFWFVPARSESSKKLSELRGDKEKVATLVSKQAVHGEPDVKAIEQTKQQLEAQLAKARQLLLERDALLEEYIPDENGVKEPREPGAWKLVYDERMNALEDEIRRVFPNSPSGPIVVRKHWGDEWPTPEEVRRETKNDWIQYYLFQALAKVNDLRVVIPTLRSFSMPEQPERLLDTGEENMFRPWPFEFEIATEFQNLPLVLNELLRCRISVNVTGLKVDRRPIVLVKAKGQETTGRVVAATSGQPGQRPGRPPAAGLGGPRYMGRAGERPPIPDEFMMGGPPTEDLLMGGPPAEELGRGGSRPGTPRRGRLPVRRNRAAVPGEATVDPEAGMALVDVSIRGYVRDYVSPEEASGAAGQEPAQ